MTTQKTTYPVSTDQCKYDDGGSFCYEHNILSDQHGKVRRTTKVWMAVSVEIDVDALEAEYGRTFTVAEAKDDARHAIVAAIYSMYPGETIVARLATKNQ